MAGRRELQACGRHDDSGWVAVRIERRLFVVECAQGLGASCALKGWDAGGGGGIHLGHARINR